MSTTLTVRISEELLERLETLAKATDRSKSYLSAEAIESYVAHELPIVEGILRGLEDIKAGRTVSHEEAMARVRATIQRAGKSRKKLVEKA